MDVRGATDFLDHNSDFIELIKQMNVDLVVMNPLPEFIDFAQVLSYTSAFLIFIVTAFLTNKIAMQYVNDTDPMKILKSKKEV